MVERARDKFPAVRLQAVRALHRLQDPTDESDEVLIVYRELLESDPSKDVRKMVLACLEVRGPDATPKGAQKVLPASCFFFLVEKHVSQSELLISEDIRNIASPNKKH